MLKFLTYNLLSLKKILETYPARVLLYSLSIQQKGILIKCLQRLFRQVAGGKRTPLPSNWIYPGVAGDGAWEGGEDKKELAGAWHLEITKLEGQKRDQWLPGAVGKARGWLRDLGEFWVVMELLHVVWYTTDWIQLHNWICQNLQNCALERANVTAWTLYLKTENQNSICHLKKF